MFVRPSSLPSNDPPPPKLPVTGGEVLVATLVASGARVLSRQGHGVLLKVRERLVFVPATYSVPEATLDDALRAAGITPQRFLQIRESMR